MSAGIELVAAAQWLYAKLTADATITGLVSTRIYDELAVQGAAFPYLVFLNLTPGNDVAVVGTGRVWTAPLWLVKAVDQKTSFGGNLATLAGRIDAVLHAASGTATNGTVWACVRERPFRLAETGPGGEQYRHLGGVYRVLVA